MVEVHARALDGVLELKIDDDGVGGADPSRGSGLTGLADRVEALGGTIWTTSPPGEGTSLGVELSLDRQSDSCQGAPPSSRGSPPDLRGVAQVLKVLRCSPDSKRWSNLGSYKSGPRGGAHGPKNDETPLPQRGLQVPPRGFEASGVPRSRAESAYRCGTMNRWRGLSTA